MVISLTTLYDKYVDCQKLSKQITAVEYITPVEYIIEYMKIELIILSFIQYLELEHTT